MKKPTSTEERIEIDYLSDTMRGVVSCSDFEQEELTCLMMIRVQECF